MIAQLHSEWLKIRTTRTIALLLVAAAAVTLLGASIEGISRSADELAQQDAQRTMFSATTTGVFFATLAGLIGVTSEFRYGTIRPTLLFEPRRRIVLGAKLATGALVGVVFGAVSVALSFGAGWAMLSARGVDFALTDAHALTLVFGTVAASALSALVGVAVGTLIRNQVGAFTAVLTYAFVVDALLFSAIPSVGRYLPGKAGDALVGRPVDDLLLPAVGAWVLAAWTLAFALSAAVRNDHTDV